MIDREFYDFGRVLTIPPTMITQELEGIYSNRVLQDMRRIMAYYDIYENGIDFPAPENVQYVPADLKYKRTSAIIDKEVRFLFSKPPEFTIEFNDLNTKPTEADKDNIAKLQQLVENVLQENNFNSKLIKGAKDCFIGERIAFILNFNETGISVSISPSLEFVYDVDISNADRLTKLVVFYNTNTEKDQRNQRVYRKRYWMAEDGYCHIQEDLFDGGGNLVEAIQPDTALLFQYIPAVVVVNDGLTGDLQGVSEIEALAGYEQWYSKLANADMDSEKMGMNPVRYAIDASDESTKDLPISAGSFWDIQSNANGAEAVTASVGVLPSDTSYSSALQTTLDRLKQAMYDQVAVPNVSPDAMSGVVTSGKTLKAIYWDLIVRCDEKMLVWGPALRFVVNCLIEGAKLYPFSAEKYLQESIPDVAFSVKVENQYSLPEDEAEEKQIDLAEVSAQTRSRSSYMKKWQGLTDEEIEAELEQIAKETQILQSAYGFTGTDNDYPGRTGNNGESTDRNSNNNNDGSDNSDDGDNQGGANTQQSTATNSQNDE